jgi:ferredoxin
MEPDLHERIEALERQFKQRGMSRRQFLRLASLLGASVLTACGRRPTPNTLSSAEETWVEAANPMKNDPTMIAVGKRMGVPGSGPGYGTVSGTEAAPAVSPSPRPTPASATEVTWLCQSCGLHFSNVETLKDHAAAVHAWRLPVIQRVDKPTYSQFLVGPILRFDEKNTALSRSAWDTAYQAELRNAVTTPPKDPIAALEGYAQVAGGIYVDDTAGVFDPTYSGYMGHKKDTGGLYSWDDPVSTPRYPVPDPIAMSDHIKAVARFYGANLVGITKLNQNWVYSDTFYIPTGQHEKLDISYKNAIVMGIEMQWERINQTPSPFASAATSLVYSRIAELSASLAKYIRMLGYLAVPCGNDTAQSIPLAIDAGLGELGRNGLLLSPEFGPRQRLCKVLTNLPLQPDQPVDFGINKYCETCFACASSCPARAILKGDRTAEPTSISNRTGILRWPVNVTSCYKFWKENGTDCSNCIAACPWALLSQRDWLEL